MSLCLLCNKVTILISPGKSGQVNGITYRKSLVQCLAHSCDSKLMVVVIIVSPSRLSLRTVSFQMVFSWGGWAALVAQLATWMRSLGREDPLEKGKATQTRRTLLYSGSVASELRGGTDGMRFAAQRGQVTQRG